MVVAESICNKRGFRSGRFHQLIVGVQMPPSGAIATPMAIVQAEFAMRARIAPILVHSAAELPARASRTAPWKPRLHKLTRKARRRRRCLCGLHCRCLCRRCRVLRRRTRPRRRCRCPRRTCRANRRTSQFVRPLSTGARNADVVTELALVFRRGAMPATDKRHHGMEWSAFAGNARELGVRLRVLANWALVTKRAIR
jgi:hypothetical protein